MTSLLFRQPDLPPRARALDTLLQDGDPTFWNELHALDGVERRTLWRQGAGAAWCKTARKTDRIDVLIALQGLAAQDDALEFLPAWGRSRGGLGAEGWRAGKPMMALLHVGGGGASVRKYQKRFKHKEAWEKLVDERCIPPRAYTERFGITLPALRRWCDRGILTRAGFAALLRDDPPAVLGAVAAKQMSTAEILHRCATDDEASDWAGRFLRGGIGPCPVWMERHPTYRALAGTLAMQGSLSVDAFLDCVPRPGHEAMQGLRESGHATAWHALRAGLLSAAGVQALAQGGATPAALVAHGPVPAALVQAWVQSAQLDKRVYLQASLAHWHADDPLPPFHHEISLSAPGPYSLLRSLPLPTERRERAAYAARQMAVHLWHRDASLVWEPGAAAVAPSATCSVCMESFDADTPAAPLVACAHPPVICRTCLVTYVEASDDAYPVCVKTDCKTPVLPEDVIRAGGGRRLAHKLALETVRRQLSHSAVWWSCPTLGCVGGTLLGVHVGSSYACRICDHTSVVRSPDVDWRRDSEKILRLVEGLRAVPKDGDGDATIRECPKCGVPTEHNGGCAHMGCRECGVNWNFSLGLTSGYAPKGADDEQTYIPRAGLLVTAGLYEGVSPGPGLYEAVMVNARKLRLVPGLALPALMPPPLPPPPVVAPLLAVVPAAAPVAANV